MAANSSLAYDLSLFEQRQERAAREMRVIKNTAPKRLFGLTPLTVVCVAIVVVAILGLFIYNNVMLMELNAQINTVNAQLEEAEKQNEVLSATLEAKMSVGAVQMAAEDDLGLVKMDKTQIHYVNLAPDDVVEVSQSGVTAGGILAKIKEYLNQ